MAKNVGKKEFASIKIQIAFDEAIVAAKKDEYARILQTGKYSHPNPLVLVVLFTAKVEFGFKISSPKGDFQPQCR